MSDPNLPSGCNQADIDAHMSDPNEWESDWLTTELERQCKAKDIDLNKVSLSFLEEIIDSVYNALDDYKVMKAEEADIEADYRRDLMKDEGEY